MIDLERYLQDTVRWLDGRYLVNPGAPYEAHQPVYGYLPRYLSYFKYSYAIMRRIRRLSFSSFLDVGSAEGYFPNLVKQLYGADLPAYTLDVSISAIRAGRMFYGLRGAVGEIETLPLADRSIDLVLSCDVIEHVPDPQQAIQELIRIARKYLVIVTPACQTAEEKRKFKPDYSYPHTHLNYFTREDMYEMLGRDILLETFHAISPYGVIGQHQIQDMAGLLHGLLLFVKHLVRHRRLHNGFGEMYCKLFKYLIRHIGYYTASVFSTDTDGWTRRRVIDTLLTDEWLSAKLPHNSLSFIAIKDCGGSGLPGPTHPTPDILLLETMWSRSSTDKSVFECDTQGRIYLRAGALPR
jgi:SAM-dependent methyltransferase